MLIKTAVTASNGDFEFHGLKPARYYISVTSVGYKKNNSAFFDLKEGQSYFLSPIRLAAGNVQLTDVKVDTKRPVIEVTPDKTILNVEGSINATGSNAFELLQKAPGVIVDKDDNIFLKGKNGVRIYIDGKLSPIGGKDLADYLRSINSTDMESIEMISNPSAKYDASGNAGIINLRLKKNKNLGTNGSVSAGVSTAYYTKLNSSFGINYRNKKINIFGNYSNYFGKNRQTFNLYRIQNDSIYDQHTLNYGDPHTHNFKTGMDIFLDAKNTLGFLVTGNFNTNTRTSIGSTAIMHTDSMLQKTLYASDIQPYKRSNVNYNINYRYANKGTELTIDGDLGRYSSNANSYQPNTYKTPLGALIYEKDYQNYTPTDIDLETIKIDYTRALGKGKLEVGGKYSNVETKNVFDFYNIINGTNIKDTSRSNKFNFTENINAAYINYSSPLGKKWTIRAGVRAENTVSEGDLITENSQPGSDVKRNYIDLFPSGGLGYTMNKENSFVLSYSRRIDRPNYEDLNPFENKIDELTYQKGNAFLRPQYTNIIEFTHTFLSRYNTTLSYSHVSDYRTNIIDTTDRNHIFRTVENLASQDIFNINFSAPVTVTKWWNLFFTFNGYRSLYKADFGQGKIINTAIIAYSAYLQQTFTLSKGLTLELTGVYNSRNIWGGTFKTDPIGSADAGLQKVIFKGNGNIKFSYTDIFMTQKFRGISDFGGAYLDVSGTSESQRPGFFD